MENLEQQIRNLLAQNKKIEAVKQVHQSTGWGLKKSKEYVDALAAGGTLQIPKSSTAKDELLFEVRQLLARNKKIQAIQLVREHMVMGLKEAKEFVESLE